MDTGLLGLNAERPCRHAYCGLRGSAVMRYVARTNYLYSCKRATGGRPDMLSRNGLTLELMPPHKAIACA